MPIILNMNYTIDTDAYSVSKDDIRLISLGNYIMTNNKYEDKVYIYKGENKKIIEDLSDILDRVHKLKSDIVIDCLFGSKVIVTVRVEKGSTVSSELSDSDNFVSSENTIQTLMKCTYYEDMYVTTATYDLNRDYWYRINTDHSGNKNNSFFDILEGRTDNRKNQFYITQFVIQPVENERWKRRKVSLRYINNIMKSTSLKAHYESPKAIIEYITLFTTMLLSNKQSYAINDFINDNKPRMSNERISLIKQKRDSKGYAVSIRSIFIGKQKDSLCNSVESMKEEIESSTASMYVGKDQKLSVDTPPDRRLLTSDEGKKDNVLAGFGVGRGEIDYYHNSPRSYRNLSGKIRLIYESLIDERTRPTYLTKYEIMSLFD